MAEGTKGPGKWVRRLAKAAAFAALAIVLLAVSAVVAFPYILPHIPIPPLEFDLSPHLKGKAAQLFASKKATADVTIRRGRPDGWNVRAEGRLLDWSYVATAKVRFEWFQAKGRLSVELDGTDWRLDADFDASSPKDWSFLATIPETRFAHDDALLGVILPRFGTEAVSNLVCSGTFSLEADGSSTAKRPVPSWSARANVKGVDAALEKPDGSRTVEAKGLRVRLGASGIADHTDIAPMFPRIDSVTAAGIVLSNVFASVRATERSYLVTEAGADCCGGELRMYSLFLDPEKLNAGATVFADNVDAGEVLARVSGFRGEATGRLHGKLPFFLKDGKTLRLRNAYLFSKPGETGNVRVEDAKPILDNLALGGVPDDTRDNLSNALSNLDYKVLKVELRRGDDGADSALALKIEGTATRGKTTVPVVLDVTFHGDIDQLVNTGMNISRRKAR